MALPSRIDSERDYARQARCEILLWTTRDGREIPLEDMSEEHIANAARVLSLWRSRLKRRGGDADVIRDLTDAITRFKALQRRRRKARVSAGEPPAQSAHGWPKLSKPTGSAKAPPQSGSGSPRSSHFARLRKPVART